MKILNTKYILSAFTLALVLTSCANNDDYDTPEITYHQATANKSIQDIYAVADATVKKYENDDIIEAYVSSSDEGGTFYKSISFQNAEGTLGFSVSIDMYNTYTKMEPGRKVYIHLKDVYYTIANGSLVIGDLYEGAVGRMLPETFNEKVFASSVKINEEDLVHTITIAQLKQDKYINTLVEISDAQFTLEAIGLPYYDANNVLGGATNYNIEDGTGSLIFRTSEFAKFANQIVPANKGKIRGVLTKFNSDYQFLARTYSDINLTEERTHVSTALGGTEISFDATLNEGFTSFAANTNIFPKYINDYYIGSRYWAVKAFSGNNYIEMTSFGGGGVNAKSYFMVPVNFAGANTLTFESKARFYAGAVLKVYYVKAENYTPGQLIDAREFTDITSSFTISAPQNGQSDANFIPSGTYDIPQDLTGNGYFIFEYVGTPTITTTMQLDNIIIN